MNKKRGTKKGAVRKKRKRGETGVRKMTGHEEEKGVMKRRRKREEGHEEEDVRKRRA